MKPDADFLIEVSWEVCNKVGGIYTVLRSKISQMRKFYGENYILIGPYLPGQIAGRFYENPVPDTYKSMAEELEKQGIQFHCGKWIIEGEPSVILVDFTDYLKRKDELKTKIWQNFKIDSLNAGSDFNEPAMWGRAAGKVIESLVSGPLKDKKAVAHFHEWLSGTGLLYLKEKKVKVATVFHTHATVLGRTLAAANICLFQKEPLQLFKNKTPDEIAYQFQVHTKHQTETVSAQNADVFVTVSEITAMEAEQILKRKPDMILPNGMNFNENLSLDDSSIKHRTFHHRINEFLIYYFFPYYTFELRKTRIFFIAGRYEFRAKGIDIFIKALAKLNGILKQKNTEETVVAFIWIPAAVQNIRSDLLRNKMEFENIKSGLDDEMPEIERKIIITLLSQKDIKEENLFKKEFLMDVKRRLLRFAKTGNPPIVTHELSDTNDIIYRYLIQQGLQNSKEDRVKVIYYPLYLSETDGLLNLNYYQAMQGAHLGVFPSFYEPWGYTPLEAGALGIPSVTTDLAGFGRYFMNEVKGKKTPGLFSLFREGKSDDEVVEQLTEVMHHYTRLTVNDRIENILHVRDIARMASWKRFVRYYIEAHNLAVSRCYGTIPE